MALMNFLNVAKLCVVSVGGGQAVFSERVFFGSRTVVLRVRGEP